MAAGGKRRLNIRPLARRRSGGICEDGAAAKKLKLKICDNISLPSAA